MAEDSPTYPPETIPTVFADGVMNLSHTREVVKFYLSRFDPSVNITGLPLNRPFAQVVMSMSGFVATSIFFEEMLKQLIEQGTVDTEFVEKIRNIPQEEEPSDGKI